MTGKLTIALAGRLEAGQLSARVTWPMIHDHFGHGVGILQLAAALRELGKGAEVHVDHDGKRSYWRVLIGSIQLDEARKSFRLDFTPQGRQVLADPRNDLVGPMAPDVGDLDRPGVTDIRQPFPSSFLRLVDSGE